MYDKHLEAGRYAVGEAMRICKAVQNELTGGETITKSDKSPVTIADYAAQAMVCRILADHFPHIPIVGEERADALKKDENKPILEKALHFLAQDEAVSKRINRHNLFDAIDLGGGQPNNDIFWTLDPVDGTKGFLRGEQFAVALALMVNGKVAAGILGCPNLQLPNHHSNRGFIFHAMRGQGTTLENMETGETQTVSVSDIRESENMRFVESYVSSHSNLDMQLEIARRLKMEREPVQMDSQVKYAVAASGNAEIYLRIPHPDTPNYKEKIWDHAAGSIVVEEAGGIVTDIFGKPLDFSAGKTLKENTGIVAATQPVHQRIIHIIHELSN